MNTRLLIALLLIALFPFNVGSAQDNGVFRVEPRFEEGGITFKNAVKSWEIVPGVGNSKEAFSKLEENGWDTKLLDVPVTSQLELFKRNVSPGVNKFLISPKDGNPVELSPVIREDRNQIHAALWGGQVTSESIKNEIIDGMNAAIDALCSMRARPSMIRAKANAFGVVEVEATWDDEDICE